LHRSPVFAIVLVLAAAYFVPIAAQEATPAPAPANGQLTAIVVSAIGGPIGVPGSDGLEHIEYDLVVTNVFSAPVMLSTIDVITLDGDPLLSLAGEDLVAATQPLLGLTPLEEIPASGTAAVMIDVAVPSDQLAQRLTHRITYTLPTDAPGASQVESLTIDGPELVVDDRAPVVVAPPVHGPGWLNAFSCCDASSIHRGVRAAADGARIVKSETFAIDWILLQDDRLFEGDGARNEQWFAYGTEVTAAAPGTVVFARDGLADGTPKSPPTTLQEPGDGAGNHVIVEIEPGVWAFYAHLQEGSVAVEIGDQVVTGQPIGRLGNSGNSIGPHLHFGLIDGVNPLTANSVPMVLDDYELTGSVDPASLFASLSNPDALVLHKEETAQPQSGTLPLNMTVTDFS
jgi:murein DD-endopeptidase MepM/ murein hydrolase activator NlpD